MRDKMLRDFLDSHHIEYVTITHSPAFTAQRIAASAHIPGKELAKTVMIKVDDKLAMAIVPATYRVDFDLLKELIGSDNVELATEREFGSMFPECEVGAMSPFGNLYGMDVFVAASLAEDDEIAFNAGSHTELVKMHYDDFEKLVRPKVVHMSVHSY